MSKITAKHLSPFAAAFDAAVRDGSISLDEAMEFNDRIESTVLEKRLAVLQAKRKLPPPPRKGARSTTVTEEGNSDASHE
jgi:hypothetical protein